MEANIQKTKYLHWSGDRKSDNKEVRICKKYKYLGVTLNQKERDDQKINNRITKTRKIITCLNDILWGESITKKKKFNIYEIMIKSIMLVI